MKKKVIKYNIPADSIILKDFDQPDYADSFHVYKETDTTVDEIIGQIFESPKWSKWLFVLRDKLIKPLGLKTNNWEGEQSSTYYTVGSKAILFTVFDRNENKIVMAEDDKHLSFKTSVIVTPQNKGALINQSTIVKYHNFFGHVYFTIIKPFHRLLMFITKKRFNKQI